MNGDIGDDIVSRCKSALSFISVDERSKYDSEIFLTLFKRFLTEAPTIDWSQMKPMGDDIRHDELPSCGDEEQRILKRVCVLKLNGGLGTTMGCDGPKSLINVREDNTFLDIAYKQNRAVNKKYQSNVPLILMNSFNTDQPTKVFVKKKHYDICTFTQSRCPRIFADSLLLVPNSHDDRPVDGWYPPGHGNVFHSMDYCGLLDNLIDQGRDICFISNIDNMGATVDLKIAKKMIDSDIDYLMEVTEKTAADTKGGTLIKIYGKPMHLEMPQVPKDHIDEFCSMRTFKLFNTNNIWVNLKAVKRKLPTMSMEIIVNKKTLRTGEKVVQLETSVGGAIRNFDKVCNVRVSRARFLPVKKTQDLLAVMSNLYEVDPEFNVHLRIDRPIPYAPSIKLSDHFNSLQDFLRRFPTVPDLRDLIRLKIDGDVCFGTNVVLKGDVIIVADEGHHLSIPSMSFIDNKFVTGRLQLREN